MKICPDGDDLIVNIVISSESYSGELMTIRANDFITPRHSYRGQVNPESLVFNANLQEFSDRVSYIVCLTTAGKLSAEEAHLRLQQLWHQLDRSKRQLGVGENPFNSTDLN
jgi:hypothetical protein